MRTAPIGTSPIEALCAACSRAMRMNTKSSSFRWSFIGGGCNGDLDSGQARAESGSLSGQIDRTARLWAAAGGLEAHCEFTHSLKLRHAFDQQMGHFACINVERADADRLLVDCPQLVGG